MNWLLFAAKLPLLIQGAMQIAALLKVPGASKKAVVIASIPKGIELTEFALGKDVIKDPVVVKLISAYIDAEAAVLKTKAALQEGILVRAAVAPVDPNGPVHQVPL